MNVVTSPAYSPRYSRVASVLWDAYWFEGHRSQYLGTWLLLRQTR